MIPLVWGSAHKQSCILFSWGSSLLLDRKGKHSCQKTQFTAGGKGATHPKKSQDVTEEMQYLHCTWHLNPPLEKLLFHVFVHYAAAVSFLVAKSHFRLLQKPFCRPHSILLLPCHSAMKDWTPFSPGYLLLHINHLEVFFCRIPYKEWYSSNGTNFLKNDCKIQSVVTDKCIEISNWSRFINPCKNYYVGCSLHQ